MAEPIEIDNTRYSKRYIWFSRCLIIAKISLIERIFIDYIQSLSWSQYTNGWVKYSPGEIDREWFFAPRCKKTYLAAKSLIEKNMIEFNGTKTKVMINYDVSSWGFSQRRIERLESMLE